MKVLIRTSNLPLGAVVFTLVATFLKLKGVGSKADRPVVGSSSFSTESILEVVFCSLLLFHVHSWQCNGVAKAYYGVHQPLLDFSALRPYCSYSS